MSYQTQRFHAAFPLLVVMLCGQVVSAQTMIHVPADQATIQDAIIVANNGDTVLVAPGTYRENINFNGKAITVTSSGGAAVTIIDGGAKAPVAIFKTGETSSAVLNGFTLQNGRAAGTLDNLNFQGGGIYIRSASPRITNNIIQDNAACGSGGGISVEESVSLIQGNTVRNNTQMGCSGGSGGAGIYSGYNSSVQIVGNVIANNIWPSGDGGGISIDGPGTPAIRNNIITGNIATGVIPASQGGGVMVWGVAALVVQNLIYNNSAGQGGGVFVGTGFGDPSPILVNNTIFGNGGGTQGTALYALGYDDRVQLFNNILIGASGENAVYCDGLYQPQPPTFNNDDAYSPDGMGFAGTCADQGGQNGNISADPQFVDASAGNFKLQATSPAIDAGSNSAPNLPQTDYASNPRIFDGNNDCISTIDMGGYELPRTANANFSTNALTFPNQAIGTSSSAQPVTLSNTGSTCFQLSSIGTTGDFSQGNNCSSGGVPGGSSCVFSVTFSPTSIGSRLGALNISGSDGSSPKNLSVSLSGTGFSPGPYVVLSPSTLSFSPQTVGTSSAAQAITLSNQGGAALAISGITVTAPFSQSNNCPSSLAANAACTISIVFRPTSPGTQVGTLAIADNASGSPHTASLSGTGIDFSVAATPGSVTVKHAQSIKTSVSVSPLGGAFSQSVALSCSGLPTGASCSFSPASAVPGSNGASSTLTLNTSGKTPRGTFNVQIIGTVGSTQHAASIRLTVN